MRRLIAAGVILLAISVLSISGGTVVEKTEKEILKRCEEILLAPDSEKIESFEKYWTNKSLSLSFFVNREDIEEIGNLSAKMNSAGKNKDREEIFESAEQIKFVISHIAETERLSLLSFF